MKQQYIDIMVWGCFLWLVGYLMGILLFPIVPTSLIGWIIMPMGIIITLWVLFRKIKGRKIQYYFILGVFWTLIAIVLDYFLLVKAFKPADGYYKIDVYFYYALTFILPILVGWYKNSKKLRFYEA